MKVKKNIILFVFSLAVVMLLTAAGVFLFSKTSEFEYSYPDKVKILFAGDLMFDRGIRYYAGKGGGNNFIFEKLIGGK